MPKVVSVAAGGGQVELAVKPTPIFSDTAPVGTFEAGQEWVDTVTGRTYTWYVDVDTSQWVEFGENGTIIAGDVTYKLVSATTYTFVAADAGLIVRFTAATAVNATVPSGVFSGGQIIGVEQGGAGQVTVVAGTTVVNTSTTLKTYGIYALCALICQSGSVFNFTGDRA